MDGFAQGSSDEFRSLLDEMCQLGVFRRSQDRYSFRNANLLLLLGTREEIASHLVEGPRKIVDYTPRSFRARRKTGKESSLRRTMTLSDESKLCAKTNGVTFVLGSRALGLDLAGASMAEVVPVGRQHIIRSTSITSEQFELELAKIASSTLDGEDGLHLVWVPAQVKWTEEWASSARSFCQKLRSPIRYIRVVFEVSPEALWDKNATWIRKITTDGSDLIVLKKWSEDFLLPLLSEIGIPMNEGEVAKLVDATGGWPEFVQEFARQQSHAANKDIAYASLREHPPFEGDEALVRFTGNSEAARTVASIMKKMRAQQTKADEVLVDGDLPAYAEILNIPDETIRDILVVAELLGLVDIVQPGSRKWDPVFERLVLRES